MNYKLNQNKSSLLIVTLIIISISIFYFSFTSNNIIFGLFSDDAVYLLQAEAYSQKNIESNPAANFIRQESQFPPLYPIILNLFGADSENLALASKITIFCLLLSLFFIGYFSYVVTKSIFSSILIIIIITFLPDTLLLSQGLWSEFLFSCFLYGALAASEQKKDNKNIYLLTALLICLTTLTRSIGAALIISFFLWLFDKKPKHYFYYFLICSIPFSIWLISREILINNDDYISAFIGKTSQFNYQETLNLVLENIIAMKDTWAHYFISQNNDSFFSPVLITLFFLFSCFGYLLRLKDRKLDSFFIPVYLLILMIWPYTGFFFMSRFFYPVLPLFLIYIVVALKYIISSKKYHNLVTLIMLSIMFIINVPTSYNYIKRGFSDIESSIKPYTRTRHWLANENRDAAYETVLINKNVIESLSIVHKFVSHNECVYAIQTPIVMLYSKRKSIFLPYYNTLEQFEKNTQACNYFIAMPMSGAMINHPVYYPLEIINNNQNYEITPLLPDTVNNTQIVFLIKRATTFSD